MNKNALIVAFKTMMYVAEQHGEEAEELIEEEHKVLRKEIQNKYDFDVVDMIENIPYFYDKLKEFEEFKDEEVELDNLIQFPKRVI